MTALLIELMARRAERLEADHSTFQQSEMSDEDLATLKKAKGGSWYDGWRPYCLVCQDMPRMSRKPFGFECPDCSNMINWDLTRHPDSPVKEFDVYKAHQ